MLSNIENNTKLIDENYRTPAELAIKDFIIKNGKIRNSPDKYHCSFNRKDLAKEVRLLFSRQREKGNQFADEATEEFVIELLMRQKDALSGDALLKMVGNCSIERDEKRVAKATYSAERFVWLSKMNNLKLYENGLVRPLTQEEKNKLIEKPYEKSKLTYQQIKTILDLDEKVRFNLSYCKKTPDEDEKETFIEMKAYHSIRRALEKKNLKQEWQKLSVNHILLDKIGSVFSIYKKDSEIQEQLKEDLSPTVLEILIEALSFSGFMNLSHKAISKLLPLMERGIRYDEALSQIYDKPHKKKFEERTNFLPKIPPHQIYNPNVYRALTQIIKVINNIIKIYGIPNKIHIETARDLAKNAKQRKEIESIQRKNKENKESARQKLKKLYPGKEEKDFSNKKVLIYQLYEAQHGKCLYSDKKININQLFEPNYVEIDHVLPLHRTFDDSFNNKILVLTAYNQEKRDQTPYEWLNGNIKSLEWENFVTRVENALYSTLKKQKILTQEDLNSDKLKSRNLNDTRTITKMIANHIENNLNFPNRNQKNVFTFSGKIVAHIRKLWGFEKNRKENNRHHALDAVIIACLTQSMLQKITKYYQRIETNPRLKSPSIPIPWKYFKKEVQIRVNSNDPLSELTEQLPKKSAAIHDDVKPLFISRAVNRKISGQAHDATIRSAKYLDKGYTTRKISLLELKLEDIPNIIGYDQKREKAFYKALEDRLKEADNNPKKAFAEPIYKPNTRIQVKKIKIKTKDKSGIQLPSIKGLAIKPKIARVDVYEKNHQHYVVPVYSWQIIKGILPNKAVVSNKNEENWIIMDTSFNFKFSLFHNDLIEVKTKTQSILGYFIALDRATGSISIQPHDTDKKVRIGIKNAELFNKYEIDILGFEKHKVKKEKKPENKKMLINPYDLA